MVASSGECEPAARAALLEAVARGRVPPPAPQVRPSPRATRNAEEASALAGLHVEELQLCSELAEPTAGSSSSSSASGSVSQAWVPVRLAKRPPPAAPGVPPPLAPLPVVLLLHATGVDKGSLAAQQAAFAARGYLAVTMDCRYHGDRAVAGAASWDGYQQALVNAWRGSGERPFLLDTVWDVLRLLDYLQQRPDVDARRIGCTGVSLGGMHTWLAAAADERIVAAAPMIGVQYFRWAVQQRRYQARVDSIPLVFQAAAADMAATAAAQQQGGGAAAGGWPGLTPEVVAAVWDKLLPGMRQHYDAPASLPLLAPRPLLIANGELDPRCPMEGVHLALAPAREAYAQAGAADRLELYVEAGTGHECTDGMWRQVSAFMDRHLRPATAGAAPGAAAVTPE